MEAKTKSTRKRPGPALRKAQKAIEAACNALAPPSPTLSAMKALDEAQARLDAQPKHSAVKVAKREDSIKFTVQVFDQAITVYAHPIEVDMVHEGKLRVQFTQGFDDEITTSIVPALPFDATPAERSLLAIRILDEFERRKLEAANRVRHEGINGVLRQAIVDQYAPNYPVAIKWAEIAERVTATAQDDSAFRQFLMTENDSKDRHIRQVLAGITGRKQPRGRPPKR